MKNNYSVFTTFFLAAFVGNLSAQNNVPAAIPNPLVHSVSPKGVERKNPVELIKDATEDATMRTPYSTTWRTASGKVITHYSSEIVNYRDSAGKLEPINPYMRSDERGWVADKQPYPCYFHSDRSTAINLGGSNEITFNKNCMVDGMPLDEDIVSIEGSKVVISLSNGIYKQLEFVNNGIKTNYVFDQPVENGISISEEVNYPKGCVLQKDNSGGRYVAGTGWLGDYVLLSADGKQELARFHAAECYDAKGHWCYAGYNLEQVNGKTILITQVPANWLSGTVYPVTIDPLVTGPLSSWAGGSTPSCIYPSFHTDSIQVTIPAGIQVNFFNITYSYETNDSIPVPLSDGLFYFSTPCGKTDTIRCNFNNNNLAGYCYLDSGIDFSSLLTQCFTPSCTPQTFWLDAYLARFGGGFNCDTTYVWYSAHNPYSWYNFSAYVAGDPVINIAHSVTAQIGPCNGSIKVTATGGTAPYTYLWSPGNQTTDSVSGLCSGTYCCMVTDSKGCTDSSCIYLPKSTGLADVSNPGGIYVYPNPSSGSFQFEIRNYKSGMNSALEIFNELGQQIYTKQFLISNTPFQINLSSQPNGIYFYRVIAADGNLIGDGKLIIQK